MTQFDRGLDVKRTNTTTRRYQPTNRPTMPDDVMGQTMPTTRRRASLQAPNTNRVWKTSEYEQPMLDRPRPDTEEDYEVKVRRVAYQPQPTKQRTYTPQTPDTYHTPRSKKFVTRRNMLILAGVVLTGGAIVGGSEANSNLTELQHEIEEGQTPTTPKDFFFQGKMIHMLCSVVDGSIIFTEFIDGVKDGFRYTSPPLSTHKWYGPDNQVYIQIEPTMIVQDQSYQVLITATCGGIGVFQPLIEVVFLLENSNKNVFLDGGTVNIN